MTDFGIVDGIVKEPLGGAHSAPEEMAKLLKRHLKKELAELMQQDPDLRIQARINKYSQIGVYTQKTVDAKEKV